MNWWLGIAGTAGTVATIVSAVHGADVAWVVAWVLGTLLVVFGWTIVTLQRDLDRLRGEATDRRAENDRWMEEWIQLDADLKVQAERDRLETIRQGLLSRIDRGLDIVDDARRPGAVTTVEQARQVVQDMNAMRSAAVPGLEGSPINGLHWITVQATASQIASTDIGGIRQDYPMSLSEDPAQLMSQLDGAESWLRDMRTVLEEVATP